MFSVQQRHQHSNFCFFYYFFCVFVQFCCCCCCCCLGQLGNKKRTARISPELVDLPKCQKVACGYAYSCAVTVDGNIYSWGAGENGRLGTGSSQDELAPVLVTTDWKAINIFAGSVHTCAIGESGQMYTWGTSVLCRFVVGPCWTVCRAVLVHVGSLLSV